MESDAFTAHTGRASELGGIVNPVDRRRSSLSRLERRRISRAKLVARSTIDMPWRKSPELRKKFQREVPLLLQIREFP